MTLILDNDDVERLLTMEDTLAALEDGYRELAAGRAITRPRSDCLAPTEQADAVYGLKSMDGVVPSAGVGAIRINSDIVTWPVRGNTQQRVKVPAAENQRFVGLVLLFSTADGAPLAIFPDGVMQRLRVGATNGIGAKLMAREDSRTVAILGSGWQAVTQLEAVCAVRNIESVRCHSPTEANREAFAAEMSGKLGIPVTPCAIAEDAIASADIVMCATNTIEPIFFTDSLEQGMHLTALKKVEIAPDALEACDRVVLHTPPNQIHVVSRDVPDTLPKRYRTNFAEEVAALSPYPDIRDLITGRAGTREGDDEITCFVNNFGLGFQFAAAGAVLYRKAVEAGAGHEIPTDWLTETVLP